MPNKNERATIVPKSKFLRLNEGSDSFASVGVDRRTTTTVFSSDNRHPIVLKHKPALIILELLYLGYSNFLTAFHRHYSQLRVQAYKEIMYTCDNLLTQDVARGIEQSTCLLARLTLQAVIA